MAAVRMSFLVFHPIPSEIVDTKKVKRPPVILLHGLYWNKNMFSDLSQLLADTLQRIIYAVDLRNHFDSPAPKECNCDLIVKDLELFMRDQQIQKASFICHSFSASVGHMFCVKNPKAVEKLVLVDRAPYLEDKEEYMNCCRMQLVGQNRFLTKLSPDMSLTEAKTMLKNHLCDSEGQRIFMKKLAADLIKENGKFQWKTDIDFLYKKAESGALRPKAYKGLYEGDILIVRGSESQRVTDEIFQGVLENNPNAKLITMENTTHLLMLEMPHQFAKEMRKYLNGGK